MFVYWLLFLYFALGSFFEKPRSRVVETSVVEPPQVVPGTASPMLRAGGLIIAVMIGLRYEVGADWQPYMSIFADARLQTLDGLPTYQDPGYILLNILVQQMDGSLWVVNLICGLIFAWGMVRFAEMQDRPWLTVLVAVPYLVIVVAMGYTRQGVAIGLIMAGLATFLRTGSKMRLVLYIVLAATFHRTAIVVIPLVFIGSDGGRFTNVLIVTSLTYVLYYFFLADSVDELVVNYLDKNYASEGAGVRVAMNLVPTVIFLVQSHRLGFTESERRIWRNHAFMSLLLFLLLFVVTSSTAVDRISLYIIPLQLVVLSRLRTLSLSVGTETAVVVGYAAIVQFTWFAFAQHASFWNPYQIWPLD